MISVILNGEKKEFETALTLEQMVQSFELDRKKIAIELNFEIINQQDFAKIELKNGDKIEIVHFIGGG